MKRVEPDLQPPTMEQFKDFVRRVVSAPKREVDQKLAEERRARQRKRRQRRTATPVT